MKFLKHNEVKGYVLRCISKVRQEDLNWKDILREINKVSHKTLSERIFDGNSKVSGETIKEKIKV